jgi:hypothetical protein
VPIVIGYEKEPRASEKVREIWAEFAVMSDKGDCPKFPHPTRLCCYAGQSVVEPRGCDDLEMVGYTGATDAPGEVAVDAPKGVALLLGTLNLVPCPTKRELCPTPSTDKISPTIEFPSPLRREGRFLIHADQRQHPHVKRKKAPAPKSKHSSTTPSAAPSPLSSQINQTI